MPRLLNGLGYLPPDGSFRSDVTQMAVIKDVREPVAPNLIYSDIPMKLVAGGESGDSEKLVAGGESGDRKLVDGGGSGGREACVRKLVAGGGSGDKDIITLADVKQKTVSERNAQDLIAPHLICSNIPRKLLI